MTVKNLAKALKDPRLTASILKSYSGPYSMGVLGPENRASISLHVEGALPNYIPKVIKINGEKIEIIATGNFRPPRPGPLPVPIPNKTSS